MSSSTTVYPLKGAVQHYAWGGKSYIPSFLNIENTDDQPFAEYWIGTHHRGPAQVQVKQEWTDIREVSTLPFLLKILDVNDMLSIQSHPNKHQAEIGFLNENNAGIPIDAKHRVFKDDNHKPELMVALSDFWLLHGFKSIADIRNILESIPPFTPLLSQLTNLKEFFSFLMNMPGIDSDKMLTALKTFLEECDCSDKNQAHYWADKAFAKYGLDKGIFSIYFFNLVKLQTGEAIYQEAGVPHAYLDGQNVEIMANSDNVFRAGLTPKHIDIDLLIEHLVFEPVIPNIITACESTAHEQVFLSPASEFEVRKIDLSAGQDISVNPVSPECYFVLKGRVTIKGEHAEHVFSKGESFFVKDAGVFEIHSQNDSTVFRALTPVMQ